MTAKETFAEKLLKIREERGLSRQKVADDLNITRAAFEYYEKGKRTPDLNTIDKIAEYYNVSVDYLMGRTDCASLEADRRIVCDYLGINEELLNIFRRLIFYNSLDLDELKKILSSHHFQAILNFIHGNLELRQQYAELLSREIIRAESYSIKSGEDLAECFPSYPTNPFIVGEYFFKELDVVEGEIDLSEYRAQKRLIELINEICKNFSPDVISPETVPGLIEFSKRFVPDQKTIHDFRWLLNDCITTIENKIENYRKTFPD